MAKNSQPLQLEEAIQALCEDITPLTETEIRSLNTARGYVLAQPLHAPCDMPPFNASAMDGYAVRKEDLLAQPKATFTLVGTSWAGAPCTRTLGPFEAVRVFTGAVVPTGCDQVVVQEECLSQDETQGAVSVRFNPHEPSESYIRPRGHDVGQGQLLLEPGAVLSPFHLGMLSACGIADVCVTQPLTVGVFSTGDELADPGTPIDALKPGQIYDSNRLTVLSLLQDLPIKLKDLGRLPDNAAQVRQAIDEHSRSCHALITSGGVSVGDADFVTQIIQELGELRFWKLNLKPGKPLAYGQIRNHQHCCHIFGLPGNPVSTIVTLLLVAKPALMYLAGAPINHPQRYTATLAGSIHHTPGRTEFQRGTLFSESGQLKVGHTGDQSSNRLSTFAHANCLIEVPGPSGDLGAGNQVAVIPFTGLLS